MKKYRAFTLVELLVVISIIALLLAILVPTLGKARNQARVTMCAVNAREIANVLALYQAANDGYAPVMLHKFSITSPGIPAKASLLSLPLQPYSGKPATLPVRLDPYRQWIMPFVAEYSRDYLQKFYVCPFVRGASDASWFVESGTVQIGGTCELKNYKSTGLGDSYGTWIWPREKGYIFENTCLKAPNHPYGPEHGKNKYGNVQWHKGGDYTKTGCKADELVCYDTIKDRPVKFSNIRGIAELTAIYCSQGEVDESSHNRVINYRSHMKSNRGGTNVVFGDGHVEWVQGSQIVAGN